MDLLFEPDATLGHVLDRRINILALAFQGFDLAAIFVERGAHLGGAVVFRRIEVENFVNFDQRKTEALAAQDQLQTGAIARRIEARLALALRRDQALVLVKTQGAGGDIELFGELANRIGAVGFFLWRLHGRFLASSSSMSKLYIDVIVKIMAVHSDRQVKNLP